MRFKHFETPNPPPTPKMNTTEAQYVTMSNIQEYYREPDEKMQKSIIARPVSVQLD